MYLPPEIPEGTPPFMIHVGFRNQAHAIVLTLQPNAQFNILAHVAPGKTTRFLKHPPREPHVKATGLEGTSGIFGFAPYAARRKKRGHGVADGLLERGKIFIGPIRTAVRIEKFPAQLFIDRSQVVRGNQGVRIEDNQVVTFGLGEAVVAGKSLADIFDEEVLDVELITIFIDHQLCLKGRTILHHDHLEVPVLLPGEAGQQFIQLVGTVVDRDDDGVGTQTSGELIVES